MNTCPTCHRPLSIKRVWETPGSIVADVPRQDDPVAYNRAYMKEYMRRYRALRKASPYGVGPMTEPGLLADVAAYNRRGEK